MAETDNMNLALPGSNEYVDVEVLNENFRKIDAAVLLALAAAAPYSAKTYALGAYCTKGGRLYRCTTAITAAETWTAGHWTETTVTAELIAHATSKSNPHGVTAAQTGAYTKGETDTLLANKLHVHVNNSCGLDCNTFIEDGRYQVLGDVKNSPFEDGYRHFFIDVFKHNNDWVRQIAYRVNAPGIYTRSLFGGNWSAWTQITTETELDTKVSKSGDTMTGPLNVREQQNNIGNGRINSIKLSDNEVITVIDNIISATGIIDRLQISNINKGSIFKGHYDPSSKIWTVSQLLHEGNAQSLGYPKIAIGSYVGTGTYSSANANSLTFDFVPKLVIIVADARTNFPGTVFINGQSQSESIGHNYISNYEFTVGWSGNTVTWYTTNSNYGAEAQLNKSGVTYRYIALG